LALTPFCHSAAKRAFGAEKKRSRNDYDALHRVGVRRGSGVGRDLSRQTEERRRRLLEVRVTKIGAAFSGNAEGCVDRD
jgi:hypothetical protein